MKKVFLILAAAFIINPQSVYDIPYGTTNLLVLDAALSEPVSSIKLRNLGTLNHTAISKLIVWGDGPSAGWDGDEISMVNVVQAPFFDTEILGDFKQRIFITLDLKSDYINEKTIQLQIEETAGLERTVRHDASIPTAPASPIAKNGEALSVHTIRWHFLDLSNNEFSFKLLDGDLNVLYKKEEADISYIDETGLDSNTVYSGRKIVAFNDRGESLASISSVFPSARTLELPEPEIEIEPVQEEAVREPLIEEELSSAPALFETIQTKIVDIQQQISEFIKQLDEFIQQSSASLFSALKGFLQSFFAK